MYVANINGQWQELQTAVQQHPSLDRFNGFGALGVAKGMKRDIEEIVRLQNERKKGEMAKYPVATWDEYYNEDTGETLYVYPEEGLDKGSIKRFTQLKDYYKRANQLEQSDIIAKVLAKTPMTHDEALWFNYVEWKDKRAAKARQRKKKRGKILKGVLIVAAVVVVAIVAAPLVAGAGAAEVGTAATVTTGAAGAAKAVAAPKPVVAPVPAPAAAPVSYDAPTTLPEMPIAPAPAPATSWYEAPATAALTTAASGAVKKGGGKLLTKAAEKYLAPEKEQELVPAYASMAPPAAGMSKNTKIIIGVVAGVAVIGGILFIAMRKR